MASNINEIVAANDDGCLRGYAVNRELGRGEQGIAYSLVHNDVGSNVSQTHVLKKSVLNPKNSAQWKREVRISTELGNAGIGPRIYRSWICNTKIGYISMQRMKSDLRKYIGSTDNDGTGVSDPVHKCPDEIQYQYIDLLKRMIDMGYVHMDNHPGNLGIVQESGKDHATLFDFGFTQKRNDLTSEINKQLALGFSLGQIIEHTEVEDIPKTRIYQAMASIYFSIHPPIHGSTIAGFAKQASEMNISGLEVPVGYTKDVYYGFMMYCKLLTLPKVERYYKPIYASIYNIRQGKPFSVEEEPPKMRSKRLASKKTRRRQRSSRKSRHRL
jgi:serine/threonine protein kinase